MNSTGRICSALLMKPANSYHRLTFYLLIVLLVISLLHQSRSLQKSMLVFQRTPTATNPEANHLLNMTDFEFVINQEKCTREKNESNLFVILVHSAPQNFRKRMIIRSRWGKENPEGDPLIYFFMGDPQSNATLQEILIEENDKYHDIVQGNFIDTNRNMTYEHTMVLKWFDEYCANVRYLIKIDDDVYVNLGSAHHYLKTMKESNFVAGSVAYGVTPGRISGKSKWTVTIDEYEKDVYPTHCRGYMLVYSSDAVPCLYQQASKSKFFWIDDIFMTGIVREKCNVKAKELRGLKPKML